MKRFVLRFLPPTLIQDAGWGIYDRQEREMVSDEMSMIRYPATVEGNRQRTVELVTMLNEGRAPRIEE